MTSTLQINGNSVVGTVEIEAGDWTIEAPNGHISVDPHGPRKNWKLAGKLTLTSVKVGETIPIKAEGVPFVTAHAKAPAVIVVPPGSTGGIEGTRKGGEAGIVLGWGSPDQAPLVKGNFTNAIGVNRARAYQVISKATNLVTTALSFDAQAKARIAFVLTVNPPVVNDVVLPKHADGTPATAAENLAATTKANPGGGWADLKPADFASKIHAIAPADAIIVIGNELGHSWTEKVNGVLTTRRYWPDRGSFEATYADGIAYAVKVADELVKAGRDPKSIVLGSCTTPSVDTAKKVVEIVNAADPAKRYGLAVHWYSADPAYIRGPLAYPNFPGGRV